MLLWKVALLPTTDAALKRLNCCLLKHYNDAEKIVAFWRALPTLPALPGSGSASGSGWPPSPCGRPSACHGKNNDFASFIGKCLIAEIAQLSTYSLGSHVFVHVTIYLLDTQDNCQGKEDFPGHTRFFFQNLKTFLSSSSLYDGQYFTSQGLPKSNDKVK